MGRESHDPTHVVVHSSIALLQERFRQLQRVKEMREERELLRILSEPNNSNNYLLNNNYNFNNTTMIYDESSRLVFHSDHHLLIFPQRSSPPQVSLSLWPTLQCCRSTFEEDQYCCSSIDQTPLLMRFWPLDAHTPGTSFEASSDKSLLDSDLHEYSDVDTSLRL